MHRNFASEVVGVNEMNVIEWPYARSTATLYRPVCSWAIGQPVCSSVKYCYKPGVLTPMVCLRAFPNGYQMALFLNYILPVGGGGIVRFLAIYKVSTQYAPPYANSVILAINMV